MTKRLRGDCVVDEKDEFFDEVERGYNGEWDDELNEFSDKLFDVMYSQTGFDYEKCADVNMFDVATMRVWKKFHDNLCWSFEMISYAIITKIGHDMANEKRMEQGVFK